MKKLTIASLVLLIMFQVVIAAAEPVVIDMKDTKVDDLRKLQKIISDRIDHLEEFADILADIVYETDPDAVLITLADYKEAQGETADSESSTPNDANAVSGMVGEALITITGARVDADRNGDQCIVFEIEWSHAYDDAENFMWSFIYKAYQDGVELDAAYINTEEYDNKDRNIKAGATLTVDIPFKLNSKSSPVDIEITELMSWTDTGKLSATYELVGQNIE